MLLSLALVCLSVGGTSATWSIILAHNVTREIGIASVTCVTPGNLRQTTSTLVPNVGAAFVQSRSDPDGVRRPVMRRGLLEGRSPAQILQDVSTIEGHSNRQYGILALDHPQAVTFSGEDNADWKGGFTGQAGFIKYAIQGNILAGPCVIDELERYLQSAATIGTAIPEMLMIGLEVADRVGGDGRCSCQQSNPTGCGCPVLQPFERSGYIGFMISALSTDRDSPVCGAQGCVEGEYYLDLNVPSNDPQDPEPVAALRVLYNEWLGDNKYRTAAKYT